MRDTACGENITSPTGFGMPADKNTNRYKKIQSRQIYRNVITRNMVCVCVCVVVVCVCVCVCVCARHSYVHVLCKALA
jgi:hypothetical protein